MSSAYPITDITLPTLYQQYIHASKYARWDDEKKRRESWPETVRRYVEFVCFYVNEHHDGKITEAEQIELESAILSTQVLPSMRGLMTAGKALARDHMAIYNCSFSAIDRPQVFDEMLYILMCGSGVGFSVERQFVNQLPVVADTMTESDTVITVADSKIGWAKGLRELIALLYSGQVPKWDLTRLRPAGAILKTMGGRSSGPEPLDRLFRFVVSMFRKATGRKLTPLECHDIACMIGEIVVVGGVRRSALLSLSDLEDDTMRHAKSGKWWETNGQRALSNNSAVYDGRPEAVTFMREWLALVESQSGERGIINRKAFRDKCIEIGRDPDHQLGVNPCAEILLRSQQTCNLSEVVVRQYDTPETLAKKVRLATILGTIQSCFTNFRYVGAKWKRNVEEERLLGVSMTGIMDNDLTSGRRGMQPLADVLKQLRLVARDTNREWAARFGIPASAAITCVKPSGTVSQLTDSASGIHPRYSAHYIRRVRGNKTDPLVRFMMEGGFPFEHINRDPKNPTVAFEFPIASPAHAVMRMDLTAIQQLEVANAYRTHWCDHNPSATIYVRKDEWMEVGDWVYKHFDQIGGVSFLPFGDDDHIYDLAPYEEVSEEKYKQLVTRMPKSIDWAELSRYESQDMTTSARELACVAGACELV